MRIAVVGTRAFPGIQGGVETHCEALFPRIQALGHDVTVFGRAPYLHADKPFRYKGLQVVPLWCPRRQNLEAIVHTFLAILMCLRFRPHIVHIHAVGPAMLAPLAAILGFKVVFTHHGQDYHRQKWGRLAKTALRLGEALGCRFADRIIAISRPIQELIGKRYDRPDCRLVYNGVSPPPPLAAERVRSHLAAHGLEPGKYILALGRLVPEKGFHDLIAAASRCPGATLAIAGDADHPTPYVEDLRRLAREAGVVMTGCLRGEELQSILAGASLFVLPSYHEGLPIALLEAMSHGLDILASDIPANRAVGLPDAHYFRTGDVEELRHKILAHLADPPRNDFPGMVRDHYDWDLIAAQTAAVYQDLVHPPSKRKISATKSALTER